MSGRGIKRTSDKEKRMAKDFVASIPDNKLVTGAAAGKQMTIATQATKGKNEGYRLDRQETPSKGSGYQSQLQIQINGPPKGGSSTIGGVRIPENYASPPKTTKAKLNHSINTEKFQDVHVPKKQPKKK
ncbi:hypothetical protein PUNSTDRAFT_133729 [Punctularia strigosozonata HHB-11173 SS5]|uniref:uncharacterized protein n=1 Tax=Punctularia strigosozonata (strain HHB-11173) TaxID=741275 RepID=UPI0004416DDA|nr:uncharacterized protein PUNSTDRAFT_133729 [Punctularia strigosozonata HHB-11173 SS5]EIN09959.1 hypothetical protein PUNSTDRAFT_133729 [Punctularia strigosozonata HHB-11173 SS5]